MDELPNFYLDDTLFEGVALLPTAQAQERWPREHHDLVAFLAVAQSTQTDFLPITWHPALQSLGEGGEAEVSQSLVDLQTNFAFKRIKDKAQPEESFHALISALLVLQNASIRRHPNVSNLLGVCWEVEHGSGNIWPVLVFEKAPLGDLCQFLDSGQDDLMSFGTRTRLCIDILSGIEALHSSNIIHGDLKPENILIFKTPDGRPVAQVTDFGFSSLGAKETDLVRLPDSGIWTAPEWHDRPINIAHAKKTDIYSAGLLFVFTLFSGLMTQSEDDDPNEPHKRLFWIFRTGTNESTRPLMWALKKSDGILPAMKTTIAITLVHDRGKQALLEDFFNGALASEPDTRCAETQHLLSLISDDTVQNLLVRSVPNIDSEGLLSGKTRRLFKMSRSMLQFAFATYTIRSQIVANYDSIASIGPCDRCLTDCGPAAAFQLAFCYATGFGVDRDKEKASKWLQSSKRTESDLTQEIALAKQDLTEDSWQAGKFKEPWMLGHVRTLSFARFYRESGVLDDALDAHAVEAQNIRSTLGEEHPVSLALQSVLSSLLREEKRWRDAEEIERHLLECRVLHFKKDSPETMTSMKNIISIYRGLGRLEEAESMSRTLLAAMIQQLGAEHYDILAVQGNLATTLLDLGRLEEAEEIYLQIMEKEKKDSGEQHVDTIITLANLAMTYHEQGKAQPAERVGTTAANLFEGLLGENDPYTLTAKNNLALIYQDQGKLAEASALAVQVSTVRKELLGPRHPQSLLSLSLLASISHSLERYADAEKAFAEVLAVQRDQLGEEHHSVIATTSSLAAAISAQGRFDEAEALESRVVELSKSSLGSTHPRTLDRLSNLASTYRDQKKWTQPEELEIATLATSREILGADHPTTLIVMETFSLTLEGLGKLDDAERLAREALQGMTRIRGRSHSSTVNRMIGLAGILESRGKIAEAEEIRKRAVGLKTGRDVSY